MPTDKHALYDLGFENMHGCVTTEERQKLLEVMSKLFKNAGFEGRQIATQVNLLKKASLIRPVQRSPTAALFGYAGVLLQFVAESGRMHTLTVVLGAANGDADDLKDVTPRHNAGAKANVVHTEYRILLRLLALIVCLRRSRYRLQHVFVSFFLEQAPCEGDHQCSLHIRHFFGCLFGWNILPLPSGDPAPSWSQVNPNYWTYKTLQTQAK